MERSEYVAIGYICRAHGIRGVVLVESLTDNPKRFETLSDFFIELKGKRIPFRVESCSATPKGWLVKLEGVNDRDRAEGLKGGYLQIGIGELPELEEGSYYEFDLIGIEVYTTSGRRLGKITEVNHNAANDIYVIKGEKKELLLPAIRDVVKKVDIENKRMEVELLSGLESE